MSGPRIGDCPNGCGWTNLYATCQDGSREAALHEHLQGCGVDK